MIALPWQRMGGGAAMETSSIAPSPRLTLFFITSSPCSARCSSSSVDGARLEALSLSRSSEHGGAGNAHIRGIQRPNKPAESTFSMSDKGSMLFKQGNASYKPSHKSPEVVVVQENWKKDAKFRSLETEKHAEITSPQHSGEQGLHLDAKLNNSSIPFDDDDAARNIIHAYQLKHRKINKQMCSSIVRAVIRKGNVLLAYEILNYVEHLGIQLYNHTYHILLVASVKAGLFREALQLFERIRKHDEPNSYVCQLALEASAKLKGWEFALQMFNEIFNESSRKPDLDLYNAIIAICGRARQWQAVLNLWKMMQADGCNESQRTIKYLLGTFVQTDRCELALEVYYTIVLKGLRLDGIFIKGLACVCATKGRWVLALEFFFDMLESNKEPDIVLCNAIIHSLGKAGESGLALRIYEWTRSEQKTNVYTLSAMLNGLVTAGLYGKALELFHSAISYLSPNVHVYNSALLACKKLGAWEKALQLIWEMERRGPEPDTISYTLLISACKADKQVRIAIDVYTRMLQMGCTPNTFTYSALIRICGKKYFWEQAQWFLEEMLHRGIAPNAHVYDALIHVLIKCGQSHLVTRYYKEMLVRGLIPLSKDLLISENDELCFCNDALRRA